MRRAHGEALNRHFAYHYLGGATVAESVIDHLSTGIVFVDDEGVIGFVNHRAEQILDVAKDDVVGKRVDMLPLRIPLYKIFSENTRDIPVEISVNGAILRVRSRYIIDEEGAFCGDLVEVQDVTDEKREKRQREEFVAMMTHDLKSPLTVMMGYIQAMQGEMVGTVNPAMMSCVEELDRNSYRLLGMIEDVLDAYRLEVGLLNINRETCQLPALLSGCCRDAMREAQSKGISFTFSIAENLPPLFMDKKQIVRVFANLLGNALKFTPRGGDVSLVAESRGGEVIVTVSDNGIGITAKDLGRIFNKYYRASSAAGFKGTGLGLAICKAIVDAHQGNIAVESQETKGSRFTVTLPVG